MSQPDVVQVGNAREIVKVHQDRDISVLELLVGVNLGKGTGIRVIPKKKSDGREQQRRRGKAERRSKAVEDAEEALSLSLPPASNDQDEP